jgi:eukaryotic-like serine/threonine-protein kinase
MEPAEQGMVRRLIGRYLLCDEFAAGGMATLHFGRLRGERGFSRTVAIKRLQPSYARDLRFVTMLIDEARLAARVQHPNVVAPLDVVALDDEELLLVMEYVHGESLARLVRACGRRNTRVSLGVAANIMIGVLHGLHAAHQAVSDRGEPLGIVHRDVSPQNILVGEDGVVRVIDFGVARASHAHPGLDRSALGKLSYMAPEQLRRRPFDQRSDVFSAGIVFWEMLTLRRLYTGENPGAVALKIVERDPPAPSRWNPQVPRVLDAVVARALARNPEERYPTAWAFAQALEQVVWPASARLVGEWVRESAGESLSRRAQLRARIESASALDSSPARSAPPPRQQEPADRALERDDPTPVQVPTPPPAGSSPVPGGDPSVSTGAMARELERFPPPPRVIPRALRWGVIGLGLFALVVGLVTLSRARRTAWVESAVQQRALGPPSSPALEQRPVPGLEVMPSAPPMVIEPLLPQAAALKRTLRPRARQPALKPPARAVTDPCRPPYTIDARGIRRIRPECLERSSDAVPGRSF